MGNHISTGKGCSIIGWPCGYWSTKWTNCSTCIQLLFVANIWKANRNYADTMNQKTKLESNFTVYIKISALFICGGHICRQIQIQLQIQIHRPHSDMNPSTRLRTMRESENVDWEWIWNRNECEKLARNSVIQLNWQLKGFQGWCDACSSWGRNDDLQ